MRAAFLAERRGGDAFVTLLPARYTCTLLTALAIAFQSYQASATPYIWCFLLEVLRTDLSSLLFLKGFPISGCYQALHFGRPVSSKRCILRKLRLGLPFD